MDFEYRFISYVLEKAAIPFDIDNIIDIDTDDLDRFYFNLKNESGTYYIRLWDIQESDNTCTIDYTLFKDLVNGKTEQISKGTFFDNK